MKITPFRRGRANTTVAHKYKPAAAQKTTARNRKQLHGTENSCTEQKAAARNRKLRHGTESCCTEQKIRPLRGINTRIPATRNTLSPTARNTLSPRADIAAARHRKLLRHGIESCCGTKQKAAAARNVWKYPPTRNRKLLQHGTFGNILLRGTLSLYQISNNIILQKVYIYLYHTCTR